MSTSTLPQAPEQNPGPAAAPKVLSEAAKRALAEAEERRRLAAEQHRPRELNGRGGLEPGRYGDWEVKGRAIDF